MSTDTFDLFAIWKSIDALSPYEKESSYSVFALCLTVFFLVLTVALLFIFFRRFRAGLRSYKEAALMTGVMFSFISLNEWIVLFLFRYSSELFVYFDMVLLYETFLPVVIFCVLLIISNLVLLFKEGFRLRNLLALGAGVLQILGIHVAFALNCMPARWGPDLFIDVLADILYIFCSSAFFGLAVIGFIYTHQKPSLDRDYALVLGCAVFGERVPPLLAARIDRAIAFCDQQEKATGKRPLLVLSGGQGPGESISEAEAMRRYAVNRGVPESSILLEDKSRSTLENFTFSRKLLEQRFNAPKGVFSTTSFHVFRSEILSVNTGVRAAGLSAPTKWYFIPNAFIREIAAFLKINKKRLLYLFVLMLIVCAAVTYFQWTVIHPGQPFFTLSPR